MNEFMDRAVKLAVENVQNGGSPFGAVLVKNNEILAEGVNELHVYHDVSGHAELLAIRRGQKKLQTNDLSDCVMYASGEPCPMCLSAMYYAGLTEAYFCQSREEAKEAGLGGEVDLYAEIAKPNSDRVLSMQQMTLEKDQLNPTLLFQEQQKIKKTVFKKEE